jgi:hypothetical protein
LGVTINGGQEQPRILLLSVPYALKAADAETVGGLPASAFVLVNKSPENAAAAPRASTSNATRNTAPPPANPAITGKGVAGFVPMWDGASDIIDSVVSQKNSLVGINTTTPAARLDVNGKSDVRDTLTLFPNGTDPTLAINGTTFKVDQTGKVTFVAGQDFPDTPRLNKVNTFTGNQGVVGNVTVSGAVGIGTTTPSQALDLGANNNMIIRVDPGNDTSEADGGYSLVGRGAGGVPNTWWTLTASVGGGFGVPANSYSIWQYPPNGVPGCCLNRFNILAAEAPTDTGGTVTIDQNGNTQQSRTAGGMVKALLNYNGANIQGCFNSALSGTAATTPPCGFAVSNPSKGYYIVDFGFQVSDRFVSVTPTSSGICNSNVCPGLTFWATIDAPSLSKTQASIVFGDISYTFADASFHMVIY